MSGPWDRIKSLTSLVVFTLLAWFFSLALFVFIRSAIMSENEPSTAESSSEGSTDVCSSDGENYYVFNGDFAPYQSEPLASSEDGARR